MKRKYYVIIVVVVLMIGLLTGCGNRVDETVPQATDIETMGISQEIDDYIKNFTGLYTSNTLDDMVPAMLIEKQNLSGDNDDGASLTIYSDLSGKSMRYELRYYGETGNQVINYYLCENFIWISRQSNYYSSWILTVGDSDILYSEIDNWIIVGETIYIMHDNGELEETEKAQLEVPLPEVFEAEGTITRNEESEKAAVVEEIGEDNNITEENLDTEEVNGPLEKEISEEISKENVAQQAENSHEMPDWLAAYVDYAEKLESEYITWPMTYSFIYVDADDIPELVVNPGATWYHILTFHDGEIDELITDRATACYMEKKNLLDNCSGAMGFYHDYIYSIENGKWVYVTGGEYSDGIDDSYNVYFTFTWEDEEVTEAVYKEKLGEVFDVQQAIEPENFESLKDILSRLQM